MPAAVGEQQIMVSLEHAPLDTDVSLLNNWHSSGSKARRRELFSSYLRARLAYRQWEIRLRLFWAGRPLNEKRKNASL